jgi:hypothetical protein
VGKSTLVGGMFAAACEGEQFAGLDAASSGALWLTEEPAQVIGEHRDLFGLGGQVRVSFRHEWPPAMDWPTKVKHAVAGCQEHGLDTLIVDTTSAWAGLTEGQENDAGAVMTALAPLEEAAHGAGLCVLALWHHRKSEGERGERLRGSSAIHGACDVVVELGREEGTARTMKVRGRHGQCEHTVELRGHVYVSTTPGLRARRSSASSTCSSVRRLQLMS